MIPKIENPQIFKTIQNPHILGAFAKAIGYLDTDKNIVASISGGSDSDIILDFIVQCGIKDKLNFVFFDTGLEYQATKEHLDYLEKKYGVQIERIKSYMSIPATCKKYGVPFINKFISEQIERLQKVGFEWEDRPYKELCEEYPHCKSSLKWWTNEHNYNQWCIKYKKLLKEYLIENPPDFKISSKCCLYAKKKTAKEYYKKNGTDIIITGLRQAEGGVRASAYTSCYLETDKGPDNYRPIWYFTNQDKLDYCQKYCIKHSRAYSQYGFKRTGCCCCPFGLELEHELKQTARYEPKLYRAVNSVFGRSYEYTRQYYQFRKEKEFSDYRQKIKTVSLFDFESVKI